MGTKQYETKDKVNTNIGRRVRVKWEIERLVDKVSRKLGYQAYTVRNTAILYGLQLIVRGAKIPKDDDEFQKLINYTYEDAKRYLLGEPKYKITWKIDIDKIPELIKHEEER